MKLANKLLRISWVLCFALFCFNLSYAIEIISVDYSNPPFMYSDGEKVQGLYPELIRELFTLANVKVTLEPVPWKRALYRIDKGEAGVGGIYKNAARLEKYDYTDALFTEELLLFVQKKDARFVFNNLNDLEGKRIGVIAGWSYGDEFDKLKDKVFNIIESADDAVNFNLLRHERIYGLIAIKEAGKGYIKAHKLENQIVALSNPIAKNDAFIAFSKNSNKGVLINKLNVAIKTLKKSKKYTDILEAVFKI